MRYLKLKWSQRNGLRACPHDDVINFGLSPRSFAVRIARDLLDLKRWNYKATALDWPEWIEDDWHDEVRRAMIDLKVTDTDLTLYTRVALAMISLGMVRNKLRLEDALTALEHERALP